MMKTIYVLVCVCTGYSVMRLWIVLVILTITTPVYAQTVGSTSGAMSTVDISNPANSTNHLITTPTVVAPGLAAAGVETCLGSASAGLSVMGGGLTFGSTMVDSGCTIRLLARQLFAFGFQKAAVALMCQDERVAAAMAAAGSLCPASAEVTVSDRAPFAPVNGFAQEDQAAAITQEEQTTPSTQEGQATPGTQAEQAWFDRASNIN
jgi:hypothetical protein